MEYDYGPELGTFAWQPINGLPYIMNRVIIEGKSQVKWDDNTYLDFSMLYNCHSSKDTIDTISVDDMREFTEDVVLKILA